MANNPSVSVIVPVYKVEQYVKICVDSILNQTFQDFEIILVDDASPDKSFELCQKLYGDNDKVKFVRHEKNLGLGPTRNTGIKNARGKYVYFVDSDDFILPNTLERFYTVAEKNNAQVVHVTGWYELTQDEPEPILKENLKLVGDGYNQEGFLPFDVPYRLEEHWRKRNTSPMVWLCFCRRDFLEQNRIEFLPIISEDDPFNIALYCLAERYYVLNDTFYFYRKRTGSIMRAKNVEQFLKSICSIMIDLNYVKSFLDTIPYTKNYEQWRENVIDESFFRFIRLQTLPHYKELIVSPEVNEATEEIFTEIFGNNATFVKYFFNNYHLFYRRTELLVEQCQALLYQNQQLQNFIREQPELLKIMDSIKSYGKRVIVMGTPQHGNLGDHAIVLGELHILNKYFPEHKVIEIPSEYLTGELGELLWGLGLEKHIRRDDIIFYPGGGNLGNLWIHEENLRRAMIEKFHENKFVIFPQSIHFTADDAGARELILSQKIYNAHSDLHLMIRDENSFDFANEFFPQVNKYLLPDSVTALHGILDDVNDERSGVLFVLRSDKEKVRNDENIQFLQSYLAEKNIPFTVTDTVIKGKVTADIREQKVREVLLKFRRSKLVITDRFHGVIFSFITRTPVIAFKSFDTKISSGIKWFENFPSVFYAQTQDWSSIENFINLVFSDENLFAELNPEVKIDSENLFFDALNQIFATKDSDNKSRRLIVDDVNISGRRIAFKYTVQGDWQKYFNLDTEFFVEYSEDISKTPKDIAVIPFLCNVLPIAWVLDAEVIVDELDYDFYEHLPEIKKGYVDMYPRIKFGGELTVKNLIRHDYKADEEVAAFFSGGVDSFDTLIAHAKEYPTLVTLLGADIKFSDAEGWERVSKHALETAKQFQCKNLFIASSFRLFLNEGALSQIVMPLANDGWWHGFQHGIGIISHAAPYVYLHKLKRIYIASSFSNKYKFTCASDPTIDNYLHMGKCVTVHDGFKFSRQDKIRRICEYSRRTGIPIQLRVCWESSGGKNCCACEKCYRTICAILAEGEPPDIFGFPNYSVDMLKKIRRDFQKPNFIYGVVASLWQNIQDRFREKPENLPKELAWLMGVKFL